MRNVVVESGSGLSNQDHSCPVVRALNHVLLVSWVSLHRMGSVTAVVLEWSVRGRCLVERRSCYSR